MFKNANIETCKNVVGRKRRASVKGFHAIRATFISKLADKNVSLALIQSMVGHLSPEMTMVYTHPDKDAKTAALRTLPTVLEDKDGNSKLEDNDLFVHPEVQKVIDICKEEIRKTLVKYTGKEEEIVISCKPIPQKDVLSKILENVSSTCLAEVSRD